MKEKLARLLRIEGFNDTEQFLRRYAMDAVVPGICMNDGCDYTVGVEPDAEEGWCEMCDRQSVCSGLKLIGLF